MATSTLTSPVSPAASESADPVDALLTFGELYRNEAGHEVWRIRDTDGGIYAEDIASDFDAQWLAEQMVHAASR